MADENRYRRHLMEWNYSITPVPTVVRYLEGDGYTREQMTEMCGIDIISLFNSAYDVVTLDGKRYRKITSCALLKNIQSINLPNASSYLGGKGCYLIFEDGVQVAKLGSGSSYTFSSTTTSKAIIYYSLKSSNNYSSSIYSKYNYLGGDRYINPVWAFEPFDKLSTQRSHYGSSNLKQIHLQEFPVGHVLELRNCSSVYGTLRFSGAVNFNTPYNFSSMNLINEIIIEKDVVSCNTIVMGVTYNIDDIHLSVKLYSNADFSFTNLFVRREVMNLEIGQNALDFYTWYKGVLIRGGNRIVTACSTTEQDAELVFGPEFTSIDQYAFSFSNKIKSIDMSNSNITTISGGALAVGNSLTELYLPSGLTSIQSVDFYNGKSYGIYAPYLEKLVIPEGVVSLPATAIGLSVSIPHILDLPKNVVLSGKGVVDTTFKELYLRWDTPEKIQKWSVGNWGIFSGCRTNGTCILHIPQGMTQDYIDKGYVIGSTYNTFGQIIDDL